MKKELKKLALSSFSGNDIDVKKVKRIAGVLSRRELRQYAKLLKLIDSQKKVRVIISSKADKTLQSKISKMFVDKRVIFEEDPSLLLGVKIVNNDVLYDFNLKNELNEMKEFVANV